MVLRKLARVAFGNIYDFMRVGDNGDPYIEEKPGIMRVRPGHA
jgi:hypothetical protein